MSIRRYIDLVEGSNKKLFEVAGTLGFFDPESEREVLTPGHEDHADFARRNLDTFGLSASDLPPETGNRMDDMAAVLDVLLQRGWVRTNYFRGAYFMQAATLEKCHKAAKFYFDQDGFIEELVVDVGPDSRHPEFSHSFYPEKKVVQFIKTGKIA